MAMAHAYYRFNADIFAALFTKADLSSSPKQIISQVRGYSFVKCFDENDECLLHDQTRDDLVRMLWRPRDEGFGTRQEQSAKLVDYYSGLRAKTDKNNPIYDAYQLEELYHGLIADREKYYEQFWDELDESWHATKYDYMYSLLKMARQLLRLRPDHLLDRLEKGARMWMLLESQWDTKQALDISEELIKDYGGMKRIHATALAVNGICHARLGNPEDAFPSLDTALEIYNELYDALKAAQARGISEREALPDEHGVATLHGVKPERFLVLNQKGRSYLMLGKFPESRKEYHASEKLSKEEGDRRWEASALTGLANVLRYEGKFDQAYDFVRRALAMREQLYQEGIVGPASVAFSHDILGMIYRDDGFLHNAAESFERAIELWRLGGARGDIPLGWRNLGRVAHDEKRFADAEKLFLDSEQVFRELGDLRALPDLYEKMGRMYYDMGRIEQAKEKLEQGLVLAREFGNALLISNYLWELARVALHQKEFKLIPQYVRELKKYEKQHYEFNPAYAQMEFVLGEWKLADKQYDPAFDHYGRAFAFLTGSAKRRFRRHLDTLRVNLLQLPPKQRERQCLRLIRFWEQDPDREEKFPELITLCRNYRAASMSR